MPRYIDADVLKHELYIRQHMLNVDSLWKTLEIMDAQPTADVVEVVRCRDCVYRSLYPNSDKQYWCNQWNTKANYENGYCYRGRKDND